MVAGARLDESLRESERRGIHATDIGLTVSGTEKKTCIKLLIKYWSTYAELKSPAAHSRILRDELAPHFGRFAFSRRAFEYFLPVDSVADDT